MQEVLAKETLSTCNVCAVVFTLVYIEVSDINDDLWWLEQLIFPMTYAFNGSVMVTLIYLSHVPTYCCKQF